MRDSMMSTPAWESRSWISTFKRSEISPVWLTSEVSSSSWTS